jgi:PAS domain S-box-containing protein
MVILSNWTSRSEVFDQSKRLANRLLSVLQRRHGNSPRRKEELSISNELRSSEEHFRAVFKQAAVGMALVDTDGHWLRVNDKLCTITGYARDELLARTFLDITHPDDLEADLAIRQTLLDGDVSFFTREKRYVRKDGGTVWVNLAVSLVRNAKGEPERLISVVEDISERKRIEAAFHGSEARLRAVLEQIPAAVAILEPSNGEVSIRSRFSETVFGPPDAELQANPRAARRSGVHADGRPYALEEYPSWRALRRGETVIAEPMRHRRADGGVMDLEVYAAPVQDDAGTIIAAVAAAFDVSERNRAERVLAQCNAELETRVQAEVAAREAAQARAAHAERMQALGQLAGGIAHDFNNVLQAIEGAVHLIERQAGAAPGIQRLTHLALEASARGASITRRLLTFGRRADLRSEAIDLAEVLGGLREIFVHTLGAGTEVEVLADAGIPLILADKGQLETALVNLATNARDAMPSGGKLTLSAAAETVRAGAEAHPARLAPGRYVRLTVADTGIGMEPPMLMRVCEPFFTTKEVGAGTGLGLPMAKGFAEQSGGAMSIASQPGAGTTVSLWLPEAVDADATASDGSAGPGAFRIGDDGVPARLLLVDDEPLVRDVLAENLEDAGFSVLVAAGGSEAVALIAAGEAVDALITDLSMPGMDGITVIRTVRERRPGLPAILLTGYAGGDAALALDDAVTGAYALLRKPLRIHDLVDRIQVLLAARKHPA